MDSVEPVFEAAARAVRFATSTGCAVAGRSRTRLLPAGSRSFSNISAAALLDPVHGVDQLSSPEARPSVRPPAVVLEITEHERIRDYEALARVLASYRAEGIRFALDDVGEGHSTFELLSASSSDSSSSGAA